MYCCCRKFCNVSSAVGFYSRFEGKPTFENYIYFYQMLMFFNLLLQARAFLVGIRKCQQDRQFVYVPQ